MTRIAKMCTLFIRNIRIKSMLSYCGCSQYFHLYKKATSMAESRCNGKQLIRQLTNQIHVRSKCTTKIMWKWESFIYFLNLTPIWAFIYCLTVAYSNDGATDTHCKVPNFAISVSEATSVPKSSKNIWLTSIILHVYPRIFEANVIFKTFMENVKSVNNNLFFVHWINIDWYVYNLF